MEGCEDLLNDLMAEADEEEANKVLNQMNVPISHNPVANQKVPQ